MKIYILSLIFLIVLQTYAAAEGSRDKIVLGTVHFPPYTIESRVKADAKGFDHDLMVEVFSRMNLDVEIRYMPWKRALQKANTGEITGVFSCSPRDQFHMSAPISTATDALFVRDSFDVERHKISSIQDLKQYPALAIGGVDGYQQLKLLDEQDLPYDKSMNDDDGFRKLFAGRIDVFLTIKEFGDYTLNSLQLSNFAKRIPLGQKEYHVCFSKAWPHSLSLKDRFNQILREVRNDGTFDAIHANYR